MLTLGALILVSVISLNFYRSSNYTESSLDFDRFRAEGTAILTSHVEQLSQYYFDEASIDTNNQKLLADMTSPGSLGFEANDSGKVDDLDDLKNLIRTEVGVSGVTYKILTNVSYVTLTNNTFVNSGSRQYHKQIKIMVYDGYEVPLIYHMQGNNRIRDSLQVSALISYWFYN